MSKKVVDNEVVVKFQSPIRKITMYFTDCDGGLDMQMAMDPEFDPESNEDPDLCMLLASTLMSALNTDVEKNIDDSNPKVYDGNN